MTGFFEFLSLYAEAFMGILIAIAVIVLVFYILFSIGLMGIAKQTNTKGGWMAWIPVLNIYFIGKLAFNKAIGITLVVLTFLSSTFEASVNDEVVSSGSILPAPFSTIASVVMGIIGIVCLYKIYRKVSEKAGLMIILSILSCGLLAPIFLFAIRKNNAIAQ